MASYPEPEPIDWGGALTLDAVFAIAKATGRPLTLAETEDALNRIGRVDRPALLFDLYYSRSLTPEALPGLVVDVWTGAEWPATSLPRSTWIDWFRKAAYPPPDEPLVIYRGAPPEYARRMSWTTNRDKAEWFADRWTLVKGNRGAPPAPGVAHVYTVTAEPAAILADVDAIEGDGGRREAEIIVDPSMLGRLRRVARNG